MKLVRANADKPHRCPCCHRVCVRDDVSWWKIYSCARCELRWWRGWGELWPLPVCAQHPAKDFSDLVPPDQEIGDERRPGLA